MARKQVSLVEDPKTPEEKLTELVPVYRMNKLEMDSYKKLCDRDNAQIKEIMTGSNLSEFVVGDVKASCTISEREDFVEEALIAKIKELKIRGIIKKREYVDMDALESAIYHEKLDAAELSSCQTIKQVVTLKVSTLKRQ